MTDAAAESPAVEQEPTAPATEPGETEDVRIPSSPPDGSAPTVEDYVNDETLDLEESGLPTETVKEIRKLRKDASKWRDTARTWTEATQGWSSEDIDTLRQALAAGRDQPEVIGQWMIEQGRNLVGDTETPVEPADTGHDDDAPLTKDAVADLVKQALADHTKQTEEEKAVQAQLDRVRRESEDLGFGPSHPLHAALFSTAKANNLELSEAAELLKQAGAVADQTNTQDAPAEAGRTPVPPEGVTPAGTREVRDPRQAAIERLNRTIPEGKRGFAEL